MLGTRLHWHRCWSHKLRCSGVCASISHIKKRHCGRRSTFSGERGVCRVCVFQTYLESTSENFPKKRNFSIKECCELRPQGIKKKPPQLRVFYLWGSRGREKEKCQRWPHQFLQNQNVEKRGVERRKLRSGRDETGSALPREAWASHTLGDFQRDQRIIAQPGWASHRGRREAQQCPSSTEVPGIHPLDQLGVLASVMWAN